MTPTNRKWKSLKYSFATWEKVPDQRRLRLLDGRWGNSLLRRS